MEEYLTTDELCDRIKYQRQTVYNLIHRKVFLLKGSGRISGRTLLDDKSYLGLNIS